MAKAKTTKAGTVRCGCSNEQLQWKHHLSVKAL
jgi:hypothetical protein